MVILLLKSDEMRYCHLKLTWAIHGAQNIFSAGSMMCVNGDCTVYLMHTHNMGCVLPTVSFDTW